MTIIYLIQTFYTGGIIGLWQFLNIRPYFYTFNIYVLFYATCNLIKSLLPLISGEYYHVKSSRTLLSNAKQCKKHCVPTCKCMLILLDHDSTNNDFLAHEKSLFYNACDCHVRYFYNLFIQ